MKRTYTVRHGFVVVLMIYIFGTVYLVLSPPWNETLIRDTKVPLWATNEVDMHWQIYPKAHSPASTTHTKLSKTGNSSLRMVQKNESRADVSLALDFIPGDTWRFVGSTRSVLVFSAFYLKVTSRVLVIGLRTNDKVVHTCQLWFNSTMTETPAVPESMSDNNGRKYRVVIFKCQVRGKFKPDFVSIVPLKATPTHRLPVHSADPPAKYPKQFTVCLMPLNYNYSRAFELVEWIELNRILGADKFIVYNYSSASNVASVLDYYSSRDLAEVVQWHLPLKVDTWPPSVTPEIHYFGQVAALQDCLHRAKSQSRYVVNIDVDEFLIPKKDKTWVDLIKRYPDTSGAYLFRNSFFRKEWNNSKANFTGKDKAEKYQLVTLLKTKREKKVYKYDVRSKYITRTDAISSLMVHSVSQFRVGFHVQRIPPDEGMLHHYRNWRIYNDPEDIKMEDRTVVDTFPEQLIRRVVNTWNALTGVPLDLHTVPRDW